MEDEGSYSSNNKAWHGCSETSNYEYLNTGQILVTTFDQPLFALAKYVQWKGPAIHGEAVHAVMLGGLHTEMALLGDILEGSG